MDISQGQKVGLRSVKIYMKTTKKQFKMFIKQCNKWKKKLGINDIRFDFFLSDTGEDQANVNFNLGDMVATIEFNRIICWDHESSAKKVIEQSAKHEMIHLLIGELYKIGCSRFITYKEMHRANESLVRRLEDIIK